MKTLSAYEKALQDTKRLLRRYRTAAEVAAELGCSLPTAYSRIYEVGLNMGCEIETLKDESRKGPGPRATRFRIRRGGAR